MEKEQDNNKNLNIPEILKDIVDKFKTMYPNISKKIILNLLIVKLSQMLTCKRITIDESGRTVIPNWFSLIFLQSGGGKDRLAKDVESFVFKNYNEWHSKEANNLYQRQLEEYKEAMSKASKINSQYRKGEDNNAELSRANYF